MLSPLFNSNYSPNGYKVPMEFHVYFFPRIGAVLRWTKMHLKVMLLMKTDFCKIITPFMPAISW